MCGLSTDQAIPLEAVPLPPDSVLTLVDADGVIRNKSPRWNASSGTSETS